MKDMLCFKEEEYDRYWYQVQQTLIKLFYYQIYSGYLISINLQSLELQSKCNNADYD